MEKMLHPVFWGIAIFYIFPGHFLPYPVTIGVKAAPILLLFLWSFSALSGGLRTAMAFALLASALGDILLAVKADMFVPGLASFLVAQLTYAGIFWSRRCSEPLRLWLALSFIPVIIVMALVILPATDNLLVPVIAYLIAISLMVLGAAMSDRPWQWLYVGACTFAVSDSLIAINKFVQAVPYEGVWIMGTYYLAQYLIVSGVIRGERS